ncbi:kinase-like protein [Parachaetomium inaequale]|uniref:Kinase-like protein n=1 Tax=Parachaetomium inaequale TaxID=2588326 RepID=A0AAN6PME7_9PEZI|nr:kinase-like protein [Parachaetomium inaequale]
MARLLSADAVLTGRLSSYTIVKELYKAPNRTGEKHIVKSIRGHWRLRNEADVLKRYQSETPFLRPLVDDIIEPADPPSTVLRHLDSDVLTESNKKRLSRPEIKQVARCVLEALCVLHRDGKVHTDVKLDNIFVQLGDCGGVVSQQSSFAKEGHLIGAAFTRSPEATFQLPWGTATDTWSFGNAILSLVFGGRYHLFNPKIGGVDSGDDDYELTVLKRMHRFFGPYPPSYSDFNDPMTMALAHRRPKEIPPADKEFILKIMKLHPRDRPTAEELLADVWFTEESQDTRALLPGEGP